jgi:hypothetical protein
MRNHFSKKQLDGSKKRDLSLFNEKSMWSVMSITPRDFEELKKILGGIPATQVGDAAYYAVSAAIQALKWVSKGHPQTPRKYVNFVHEIKLSIPLATYHRLFFP